MCHPHSRNKAQRQIPGRKYNWAPDGVGPDGVARPASALGHTLLHEARQCMKPTLATLTRNTQMTKLQATASLLMG